MLVWHWHISMNYGYDSVYVSYMFMLKSILIYLVVSSYIFDLMKNLEVYIERTMVQIYMLKTRNHLTITAN